MPSTQYLKDKPLSPNPTVSKKTGQILKYAAVTCHMTHDKNL